MNRLHLAIGPAEHGVVRFALDLAAERGEPVVQLADVDDVEVRADVVQLHWTDGLFGPDTASAAAAFTRLCTRLRARTGCLITSTLHDLPDPADEPGRYARRSRSYRQVVAAVDSATVASQHELRRLQRVFGDEPIPVPVGVVPLPIVAPAVTGARPEPLCEVGVFGFVYPGKGHHDALAAMRDLPADVAFTALGRAADGHADLVTELRTVARHQGRDMSILGYLPDDGLMARLQRVAVPVVPGAAVSASGSLNTWISAGRRPLVATGAYAEELAALYPGGLRLYRPAELPGLLAAALADPASTWIEEPPPAHLLAPSVARAHA